MVSQAFFDTSAPPVPPLPRTRSLRSDPSPPQVWNNQGSGIMLHRESDRATVTGNIVYDNGDAGLALFESSECDVFENSFKNNLRE